MLVSCRVPYHLPQSLAPVENPFDTWMSPEDSKWLVSGYNPNIPHL